MKFSESWLREWVNPPIDSAALAGQLTLAGLEVDGLEPAAGAFDKVVVGEVVRVERHPDADKLTVCAVNDGDGETAVVCGAPNVRAGMKVPFARVGASLPGGLKIRKAKLRGVESQGMLCSAKELGLSDDAAGLMDLDPSLETGADFRSALSLDDTVISIDLTPNRGDCFGLAGVAREVAALNDMSLTPVDTGAIEATSEAKRPITLETDGCPVYVGRIVSNIDPAARTPLWMVERLRRSGIRAIHPVVDVTNFVMLELGQPMHGFDLAELNGGITVRQARAGETLTLLDGKEAALDPDVMIIADDARVLALAGIMGGEGSGVGDQTRNIYFESAFFAPLAVMGRARRFGLHTDASQRFERGVDPTLQVRAIERATALLLEIAGGEPGPVTVARREAAIPESPVIGLRRDRVSRVLGAEIDDTTIVNVLEKLGMLVKASRDGWEVTPPASRFDCQIEVDLIEEIARIHGYANIPETDGMAPMITRTGEERITPTRRIASLLIDRGYQEVITYSFISPEMHDLISPESSALELQNPIAQDRAVMRRSLWPGLLEALRNNVSRARGSVRIFEAGLRFVPGAGELKQEEMIAGLIYGALNPEQWGDPARPVDFYDVKGDVEGLLSLGGGQPVEFLSAPHPALHPGQSACLRRGDDMIGWIGALHPKLLKKLDLDQAPFVFELMLGDVRTGVLPAFEPVSKYPVIRRDLAVIVEEKIDAAQVLECVRKDAPAYLTDVFVFDIYRGQGIDSGRKSVALGLILQEKDRTLTDQDADGFIKGVVERLAREFDATLRD